MPKIKFTKEQILMETVNIAREEGFDGITMRRVAERVGCSTAPIYTAFGSRQQLIYETALCCIQKVMEYTSRQYTKDRFLNVGIGIITFTIEEPNLYKALFIERSELYSTHDLHQTIGQHSGDKMKHLIPYCDDEEAKALMERMSIFTHGIAVDIVSGKIEQPDITELAQLLGEVGGDLILATLYKNGRLEAFMRNHINENKEE